MNNLKFYGPFHFNELDAYGNFKDQINKPSPPNKKGIYIWGFVCNEENSVIKINETDLSYSGINSKFIPYYVGKHQSSIYSRIKQHNSINKGDTTKYIRISNQYLSSFFKDENFPIQYRKNSNYKLAIKNLALQSGLINYFNDVNVLTDIYGNNFSPFPAGRKNSDYPITLQKINNSIMAFDPQIDTLHNWIVSNNNFYFMYALDDDFNNFINLDNAEVAAFYSLKGKTVSQTKKYENPFLQKIKSKIIIESDSNVFKDQISDMFLGY